MVYYLECDQIQLVLYLLLNSASQGLQSTNKNMYFEIIERCQKCQFRPTFLYELKQI